mmetsp:Transcript_8685/g.11646  ORF Transcript_8685/g.11646 Transcript_8685/m.11646 type:complete len:264 (+) Transcript_8685:36-827(+)
MTAVDSNYGTKLTTKTTVQFNVGGKKYEVSRSMLGQHSDTMLARMASGTWQRDTESCLFVERDGGRFQYVLDYMRDGEVTLPAAGSVTKESLLKELVYFGFSNVDPSSIRMEFSCWEAPTYMSRITQEYQNEFEKLKRENYELNLLMACNTVAYASCIRYMCTGSFKVNFSVAHKSNGMGRIYSASCRTAKNELDFRVADALKGLTLADNKKGQMVLNQCLAKYGLSSATGEYKENRGRVQVGGSCGVIVEDSITSVGLTLFK